MVYRIDEASLSRAWQHVVQKKSKSWGMITAFRNANTPKDNRRRNKQLESELRSMGLGYFKVEGHWQECQDPNIAYNDCPKEKLVDAVEESLFVPNITAEQIGKLGKKYEQDAVIYGGEDTNGDAELVYKDGSREGIGRFHPGKVAQAYSKVKGGSWIFQKDSPKPKEKDDMNKKSEPIKLKSLLPKGVSNRMVKNPETGRSIKVTSALKYDKNSPVYKAAQQAIKKRA